MSRSRWLLLAGAVVALAWWKFETWKRTERAKGTLALGFGDWMKSLTGGMTTSEPERLNLSVLPITNIRVT